MSMILFRTAIAKIEVLLERLSTALDELSTTTRLQIGKN
jgi:hypothetical protein